MQDRFEDLRQFLERFPYLGLTHEFGQQLYALISDLPKAEIGESIWWRARKAIGSKRLCSGDMYPPRAPEVEGRFNHFGQSVFYLASEAQAAAREILDDGECLAWIQKFQIHDISRILDLTAIIPEPDDIAILGLGLINRKLDSMQPRKESPWKPEYFIPRFIADCAKHQGFTGIQFHGNKHDHKNLVLFDWKQDNVEPLDLPRTLVMEAD